MTKLGEQRGRRRPGGEGREAGGRGRRKQPLEVCVCGVGGRPSRQGRVRRRGRQCCSKGDGGGMLEARGGRREAEVRGARARARGGVGRTKALHLKCFHHKTRRGGTSQVAHLHLHRPLPPSPPFPLPLLSTQLQCRRELPDLKRLPSGFPPGARCSGQFNAALQCRRAPTVCALFPIPFVSPKPTPHQHQSPPVTTPAKFPSRLPRLMSQTRAPRARRFNPNPTPIPPCPPWAISTSPAWLDFLRCGGCINVPTSHCPYIGNIVRDR